MHDGCTTERNKTTRGETNPVACDGATTRSRTAARLSCVKGKMAMWTMGDNDRSKKHNRRAIQQQTNRCIVQANAPQSKPVIV